MTKQHWHTVVVGLIFAAVSCFLVACHPTTPHSVNITQEILPTPTRLSNPLDMMDIVNENQEENQNLYQTMLDDMINAYHKEIMGSTTPIETKIALSEELAIIEAEATFVAQTPPPFNPDEYDINIDIVATIIAIDHLTQTPEPRFGLLLGIIDVPPIAQISLPRQPNTWIKNAWQGYVEGELTGIQVGSITFNESNTPITYGLVYNGGIYMTTKPIISSLGIIYIENDRYAILEVFDENGLPTGVFYYFDILTKEFISQTTAELQIANFPPQAETTPTPPIAVTIPPIQPQHPRQP